MYRCTAADCKLDNKQRVTCTWNNVGAGDTKSLQFTVKGSDAETIKNVATVSSAKATPKSAEKTVILNAEVPPAEVSGCSLGTTATASAVGWLICFISLTAGTELKQPP